MPAPTWENVADQLKPFLDEWYEAGVPLPGSAVYPSRATAIASTPTSDYIYVLHRGILLMYVQDENGTALTTANGIKWSPSGLSCSSSHFGALGNGSTNDTTALQRFFNWIKGGRTGYLERGTYLSDTLKCEDGVNGFVLIGAGMGLSKILHRTDDLGTQGIYIADTPNVFVTGVTVDNQETPSEEGEDDGRGIGISVQNCPRALIDRCEAINTGSVGILLFGPQDEDGEFPDIASLPKENYIRRCRTDNCSRGIQLVGVRQSGITDCYATNSIMSGIYLKCPIADSYIADCISDTAFWGFAIGSSFETSRRAIRIRFSNLIAVNAKTGFKGYCLDDSILDGMSVYLQGVNTDGSGDGIRIEESNRVIGRSIRVQNVGELRGAICFASSHDCDIELSGATTFGTNANHARTATSAASNNNTVKVDGYVDTVTTPFSWNVASSGNRYLRDEFSRTKMYFGRDLYGYAPTLNSNAYYAFGFPEGSDTNYLALMSYEADGRLGIVFGSPSDNTQGVFRYSLPDNIYQFFYNDTEFYRLVAQQFTFMNSPTNAPTKIRVSTEAQAVAGELSYNPHLSPPQWRVRADDTDALHIGATILHPGADNTVALGAGGLRFTQLFAATATISTSDERQKKEIDKIEARVLAAWDKVEWAQFKFIEGKRIHFGLIAQDIYRIFKEANLDPFAYGLLCYDEWIDEITGETKSSWGVRYEEAFALEAALQRRKI